VEVKGVSISSRNVRVTRSSGEWDCQPEYLRRKVRQIGRTIMLQVGFGLFGLRGLLEHPLERNPSFPRFKGRQASEQQK